MKRISIVIAAAATLALGACGAPTTTGGTDAAQATSGAVSAAKPKAAPKPAPAKPKAPAMTSGQRNALRAAENYVQIMPMSKAGLIAQLSSPAGDQYSKADATFAANTVKANWDAEAVEAAKNYQSIMPMSRSALINQLSSSAGDKFTKAQATQAADAVL